MMTSAPLTFRGRLWRVTKRLTLTGTLLLVAAVPAGYFGLPALAGREKSRLKVEKALTRTLGTPVQVASMSFTWKDGLSLRDVSTAENLPGGSFRIDSVTIKPRWSKLLSGKVRLRAEIEGPEIVVVDSETDARAFRLPKFGKKGFGLERLKITGGTYILQDSHDDRTIRIDGITSEGTGKLQNRAVKLDLQSLSGSWHGVALAGKGVLRLSPDGFGGDLQVNDAAAGEPELRDALRAAGVTLRKAPAMSEPF